MAIQYPHTIPTKKVNKNNLKPVQDPVTSDWILPATKEVNVDQICRAEPAGADNETPTQDGKTVKFSWMIYLPKDSIAFLYNSRVEIFNKGCKIGSGTVKRFERQTMNCKLWV